MKIRSKLVEQEAFPVSDALVCARESWAGLPEWLRAAYEIGTVSFGRTYVIIYAAEGRTRAERGDFIIRGVDGELSSVKPDKFAKNYEVIS